MKPIHNAVLCITLAVVVIVGVVIVPRYFLTSSNTTTTSTNSSVYSWATDPYRLMLNATASNVTLIIDYQNGTANNEWDGVNLTDHYTSAYDLLNNETQITYSIYNNMGEYPEFMITSINGLTNNQNSNGRYWQYYVNGVYAQIGVNHDQLNDNAIEEWYYGTPQTTNT